jgi:hypothetical protein
MATKVNAMQIGTGQAKRLCNMQPPQRLEFIAEGLPIILENAKSLMLASGTLAGFPREAAILEGLAEEECAKILILIDIIRCPATVVASRIGPMMKWFYDHLARLIYADAQNWQPASVVDLQGYVDLMRKSHYLEGEFGEFIEPNSVIFSRESALYADVVGIEDSDPMWISPLRPKSEKPFPLEPQSFRIAKALSTVGAFTIQGLKILRDSWSGIDFSRSQDYYVSRELCRKMLEKLNTAHLTAETQTLLYQWQTPMYHIDFALIRVPLEDLRIHRQTVLRSEFM